MSGLRGLGVDSLVPYVYEGHRLRRRGVHEAAEFHAALYALDARYRAVAPDMREVYAGRVAKRVGTDLRALERHYATHVLVLDVGHESGVGGPSLKGRGGGLHYERVAVLMRLRAGRTEVLLPEKGAETTWDMKAPWIQSLLAHWKGQEGGDAEGGDEGEEQRGGEETSGAAVQLAVVASAAQADAYEYELLPASAIIFLDDDRSYEVNVMRALYDHAVDNYSRDQLLASLQDLFIGQYRPGHTLNAVAGLFLALQRAPRTEADVYPRGVRRMLDAEDYSAGPWLWILDDDAMSLSWKTKTVEAFLKEHQLRMVSAEPFDIRQRQLYRLHAPYDVEAVETGAEGRLIRVGRDTLAANRDGGVVRLLGHVEQDGRQLYEGDTVMVRGVRFPGPSEAAASVEFDMNVYADSLAQLAEGDRVHVQFLVPYYRADDMVSALTTLQSPSGTQRGLSSLQSPKGTPRDLSSLQSPKGTQRDLSSLQSPKGTQRGLSSLQGTLKRREKDGRLRVELEEAVVAEGEAHAESVIIVGAWSHGVVRVYAPAFVEKHGVFEKKDLGVKDVTVIFPRTGLSVAEAMMWVLPTLQETIVLREKEWRGAASMLECWARLETLGYNLDVALTPSMQAALEEALPRRSSSPKAAAATAAVALVAASESGIDEDHVAETYDGARRQRLPLGLYPDTGCLYWITKDAPGKTLSKPKAWTKELQLLDRDAAEAAGAWSKAAADVLLKPVASLAPLVEFAALADLQKENAVLLPARHNAWARVAKKDVYYRVGDWWIHCGAVDKDGRVDLSSWMTMSLPLYLGWEASLGAREAERAYVRYRQTADVLARARELSEAPGYTEGYAAFEAALREWLTVPRVASYVGEMRNVPTDFPEPIKDDDDSDELVLDILDALWMRRIPAAAAAAEEEEAAAVAGEREDLTAMEAFIHETMKRAGLPVTTTAVTELRRHAELIVETLLAKYQQQAQAVAAAAAPQKGGAAAPVALDAFSLAHVRQEYVSDAVGVGCAILLQFMNHTEWGHPLSRDDAMTYVFRVALGLDTPALEKRRRRLDAIHQRLLQTTPAYGLAIEQAKGRVGPLDLGGAKGSVVSVASTWPTFRPPQRPSKGEAKGAGAWIDALYHYTQSQAPLKKNPYYFKQPYTVNTCCPEQLSSAWTYHALYADVVRGIKVGQETLESVGMQAPGLVKMQGDEMPVTVRPLAAAAGVVAQRGVVAIGAEAKAPAPAPAAAEPVVALPVADLEALGRRAQTLADVLQSWIASTAGGVSRDDVRELMLEFGARDDETLLVRAAHLIRQNRAQMRLWLSRYVHDYRADKRLGRGADESLRRIYETTGPAFPAALSGPGGAGLRERVEALVRLTPEVEVPVDVSAAHIFYYEVCLYLQWLLWMVWVVSLQGVEAEAMEGLMRDYTDAQYMEDLMRWGSLSGAAARAWGPVIAKTWSGLLGRLDEAFRHPEAYKERIDQLREKRKQKQIDLVHSMSDEDRELRAYWDKLGLKHWFDEQYEKRMGMEAGAVAEERDVDEVTGEEGGAVGDATWAEGAGEDEAVGDDDYEEEDLNVDMEYDDHDYD